jgi:hypothetical protein
MKTALTFLLLVGSANAFTADLTETQRVVASDEWARDFYGVNVAISGDTAIVGAHQNDDACPTHDNFCDSGAAYILVRNGDTWTEQAKLRASDESERAWFGRAVAISGDTAVIGAVGTDATGGLYVFTRSGSTWTEQAKLDGLDAVTGDGLGVSVAISGDTVVAGAYRQDNTGGSRAGAVYVFTRSGTTWSQEAKVVADDADAWDYFGELVAISGDTFIVGERLDDGAAHNAGAVYVFTRSGGTWTQQAKLTASDAASSDVLGYAVAISGDTIVTGAANDDGVGAAYVFHRSAGTWTEEAKLTPSDPPDIWGFGIGVAIDGDTLVVTNPRDDAVEGKGGAAFVYSLDGTGWTQEAALRTSGDSFGFGSFVAMSGTDVLVGEPSGSGTYSLSGAAYFFELVAATPPEQIEDVIDVVFDLPDLDPGVADNLVAPLGNAVDLLNDGVSQNDVAVCGKLNAFIQHVDNAEAHGDITSEEAAALRQAALDILDSLGC